MDINGPSVKGLCFTTVVYIHMHLFKLTRNICSGNGHILLSHTPVHLPHCYILVGCTGTLTCPTCIQTSRLDYRNRNTSSDLAGKGGSIWDYMRIYIHEDQSSNFLGTFGYVDICNCRYWDRMPVSQNTSLSCQDIDMRKSHSWNISVVCTSQPICTGIDRKWCWRIWVWGTTGSFGRDNYMFGGRSTG